MKQHLLALVLLFAWLPTQCGKKKKVFHVYHATLLHEPKASYRDITKKLESILSKYPGTLYFKSNLSTESSPCIQIFVKMDEYSEKIVDELYNDKTEDDWFAQQSGWVQFKKEKAADNFINTLKKDRKQ